MVYVSKMRLKFQRVIIFGIIVYIGKVLIHYVCYPFNSLTEDYIGLDRKQVGIQEQEITASLESINRKGPHNAEHQSRHEDNSYNRGVDHPDDMLHMTGPNFLRNYKNPCWIETRRENKIMRCLPYFKVLGVDKCGTTDLWYRLTRHPDIVQPSAVMGKETHWWSWRRFGFDIWVRNKPILHFDWYLKHFDGPALKIEKRSGLRNGTRYHPVITGEGSPTEFWDFTGWNLITGNEERTESDAFLTPDCLHHLTPELKSIVIFRNPTERAYSDYLFLDRFRPIVNISAESFHRDVKISIQMIDECIKAHPLLYCLYHKDLHMTMPVRLIPGMYDIFLAQWLRVFPADHILVLRNEDYSRDIKTHLETLFTFLDLSPLREREIVRISKLSRVFEKNKKAKSVGEMLEKTKDLLNTFYRPYNQMLANRLNDTRYLWD